MEGRNQYKSLQTSVHGVASYTINPGHPHLIQHCLTIARKVAIMTTQAFQV